MNLDQMITEILSRQKDGRIKSFDVYISGIGWVDWKRIIFNARGSSDLISVEVIAPKGSHERNRMLYFRRDAILGIDFNEYE